MRTAGCGRTVIKAYCNGVWRPVGVLKYEDGRPVFEQRIRREAILKIRGGTGIDLAYDPPLPENCVIRHIVADNGRERIYEIPLEVLRNHPRTDVKAIGPLHPRRMYLAYKHWKEVNPDYDQLELAFGL